MPKNMGAVDRVIRVIIAVVIAYLIFSGRLTHWPAIVLGILAVIFLLTSALARCPLYVPFHISTRKGGRPPRAGTS